MRVWLLYGCILLMACGSGPEKTSAVVTIAEPAPPATEDLITAAATDSSMAMEPALEVIPAVETIRRPSGVYQFLLPYKGSASILHTISFYPGRFRLQEEYGTRRDSIVVTEGTWAPSAGYIWLYKDQVVRGRYTWQGDTLHYYSPGSKKTFSMHKMPPVTVNSIWQTKKENGIYLYGLGTEPFWSVEITSTDSIVLNMPDWKEPLQTKLANTTLSKDTAVYSAAGDSLQVTVYPLFCSDGMSDFLYTRKIKLVYRGQTYQGCGEVLQARR